MHITGHLTTTVLYCWSRSGRPKLNDIRFRGVSIIIIFNAYRDKINIEASKKFAQNIG